MLNVSEGFNRIAMGSIRPLSGSIKVSWDKSRNADVSWFTLDSSRLNNSDLVAQDVDDPIQLWDSYNYIDESKRLIEMNWSRSIEFPYSIQSAYADFKLNNYDGRYNVNGDSDISDYIMPKRPVRLYSGFKINDVKELVPQFVGMTEKVPSFSGKNDIVAIFKANDFMAQIADFKLSQTILSRDIRTDEAIQIILEQFGLEPSMYSLSHGVNIIPFFYVAKGRDAGNILKDLVQAEAGSLWLDEKGIIRFEPRTAVIGQEPVMTFNKSNIVSITPSRDSGIVNRVSIKSDVRKIMDNQQVFTITNDNAWQYDNDNYRIKANGSIELWANFDDPMWTLNATPILNGSDTDSKITAVKLDGTSVASGISVVGTNFAESAKLEITNANQFPVSITFISLWGEPAKVEDTLEYEAYDQESIDKFGEQLLEITDNQYYGNYGNIDNYATYILQNRASYSPVVNLEVKGNPALQMGDLIEIYEDSLKHDESNYRVIGISHNLSSNGLKTQITAEYFGELATPFTLNRSILNGRDKLA